MVSLCLPFNFPHRLGPKSSHLPNSSTFPFYPAFAAAAAAVAGATAVTGVALAVSSNPYNVTEDRSFPNPCDRDAPFWASLSLDESSTATAVEPKTGAVFPVIIDGARRLLGIGLRKKKVFGLKNIDVYAFGVYADDSDLKKLRKKYGVPSASELKGSKDFVADILVQDSRMTVRLQIVYGSLSIGSVRSAFEESVGSRLKRFSRSENKELLQRFTSLFRDEFKLPRGSVIEISREQGYILQTKIDGKEVGSIQSKLLCQSILDLYIGEQPFDERAREDIEHLEAVLWGFGTALGELPPDIEDQ